NEAFLSRVAIPAANVHRVDGEKPPHEAAAAYERTLLDVTGGDGALDVVHLGMGPDGHLCSLFPAHPLFTSSTTKLVDALTDSPKPPPARVTLTMPALMNARALWFLVMGQNKADAVRAALTDPSSSLPAAAASRGHKNASWLLDGAAATHLKAG